MNFRPFNSNNLKKNKFYKYDYLKSDICNILCLIFDKKIDFLFIQNTKNIQEINNATNRSKAYGIGKLFFLFMFISPSIVRLKLLLQKCWFWFQNWDKKFYIQLNNEWHEIMLYNKNVSNFPIKRFARHV